MSKDRQGSDTQIFTSSQLQLIFKLLLLKLYSRRLLIAFFMFCYSLLNTVKLATTKIQLSCFVPNCLAEQYFKERLATFRLFSFTNDFTDLYP